MRNLKPARSASHAQGACVSRLSRRAIQRRWRITALAAVWSRLAGAVAIVRQAAPTPTPSRYFCACDHLDRRLRDRSRRLIDDDAFDTAFNQAIEILRASNNRRIDDAEAAGRMLAVHSRAL